MKEKKKLMGMRNEVIGKFFSISIYIFPKGSSNKVFFSLPIGWREETYVDVTDMSSGFYNLLVP
jgi:hypothetical protein